MPETLQRADFGDQTGIFDPNRMVDGLTIIGCGGIGASALPTLATLGVRKITIWDPDAVEPRNVASQLMFYPSDIGRPKVEVARERLLAYGVDGVETRQEYFDGTLHGDSIEGIVISAVDSMVARRQIWDGVKDNPFVTLLIDGRIGGENLVLIVIDPLNPDHVKWYEKFQLFSDDQATPLPCTQRAVVYPAVALGALMAATLAKVQRGIEVPRYTAQNMQDWETVTVIQ